MNKPMASMVAAWHGSKQVREEVLDYVNNRGTQRAVKAALAASGVSPEVISHVDWSKSYFVRREFGA